MVISVAVPNVTRAQGLAQRLSRALDATLGNRSCTLFGIGLRVSRRS